MDLSALLGDELRRRRQRNPRYSLRAFARTLGTHHSTLSRIMERRRRLTPRAIRALGARLGLTPAQIDDACVRENAGRILHLVADRRFRADTRWLAVMAGLPIDDVNRALHLLLYERRLTMRSTRTWTPETC